MASHMENNLVASLNYSSLVSLFENLMVFYLFNYTKSLEYAQFWEIYIKVAYCYVILKPKLNQNYLCILDRNKVYEKFHTYLFPNLGLDQELQYQSKTWTTYFFISYYSSAYGVFFKKILLSYFSDKNPPFMLMLHYVAPFLCRHY